MRRFANPTLGVLFLCLCACFISGCSKKETQSAANPRLAKSGQAITVEPAISVAGDSSGALEAQSSPTPEPQNAASSGKPEAAEVPAQRVPTPAEMAALVQRAKAGDAHAQVDLGNLFFTGNGMGINKAAAEYWWKLAARQRHPVAIENLQLMHAKPEESVSFFGTASRGNRFVFIIDKSFSMSGNRLAAAKAELCGTLRGLKPTDQFMIYFFSDNAEPIPATTMLAGTPANIRRAIQWVQSRETDGGTNPKQALRWCFNLRPDTVWLLTDGRFNDDEGALDIIHGGNRQLRARINTLAFHDQGGAEILQRIARENDGHYRFIRP